MKSIFLVMCVVFLSAEAVLNQPSQEAQRREAPVGDYGPPKLPQNQYGPPKQGPPQIPVRQQRIQAMQRLIAAMRNGGYAAQGQGRVVNNRPRPIPVPQPQKAYGPPHSSSSGSLASFMHNHNPDVRCDGWIPIAAPAGVAGGSASSGASVDTSYGPPRHGSGSSGGSIDTSYGPPNHGSGHSSGSIDTSYGPPNHGSGHSGGSIDTSYGPPNHGSGHSSGLNTQVINIPDNSYGPPNHGSGHSGASVDTSYGPPNHGSGNSGLNTHVINIPDDSYGAPPPPAPIPINTYGPPSHGHGSGSASVISEPEDSYGPPIIGKPQDSYGPPIVNKPHDSYGPPISHNHESHSEHSSSHSSHSSASSVASIDNSYGPPPPQPIGHPTYGAPQPQVQLLPRPKIPDNTYGQPTGPVHFGPPESSYGPPPSGHIQSEAHDDHHHSSQGHAAEIQTIHTIGQELQLPEIGSGAQFDNAIGLVTSTLGVSAGQNEVVQSHAIHESHTAELTNNFNGGDSYAAPPLDSYAPGKYAPSFLKPKPPQQPQQQQHHQQPQQQHQPRPQPPPRTYQPQRPPPPQPRPQYIPPTPMKQIRPQGPPPNFRPQVNSHAHSIAQGYSSGQSHSSQSHSQGHSQSIHAPSQVRQQPKYPLPHRAPVPQGLFQSIGQHVQALDNGQRGQNIGNTYLPPPAAELPIPPMKLIVPHPQPPQVFNANHHQSSGAASSSSSFSFQNQELRNVHVIHDCGKGPQLSQNYGPPNHGSGSLPSQNYGPPIGGPPAKSYGIPLGEPLTSYNAPSHSHDNYEIPTGALEVPSLNSVDFNSPSNSYGPPASGPASLDVIGLESQQRANTIVNAEQHHDIITASSGSQFNHDTLPGLSSGLSSSGLDFISAQKSHSIDLPSHNGGVGSYQLQFTTSHSDQNGNRIDAPDHQQILADGLLQSILTAIEKKPQTVPQVTEDDQETDHSEVQVFLKSPQGQEVLADKPVASQGEQHHSS